MIKEYKVFWVLIIVALMTLVFWCGNQSARIRIAAADASYRAIYTIGILISLRDGDSNYASSLLEYSLDENIAYIVEARRKPRLIRFFSVPKRFDEQSEKALSSFVTYRTKISTNYLSAPLLEKSGVIMSDNYEEVNMSRLKIKTLVEEAMRGP